MRRNKPTRCAAILAFAASSKGGRHTRQHVKKLGGHRAAIVDRHFFDGCRTATGPVTFTLPATGTSWIQVYQATDLGLSFHIAP